MEINTSEDPYRNSVDCASDEGDVSGNSNLYPQKYDI